MKKQYETHFTLESDQYLLIATKMVLGVGIYSKEFCMQDILLCHCWWYQLCVCHMLWMQSGVWFVGRDFTVQHKRCTYQDYKMTTMEW